MLKNSVSFPTVHAYNTHLSPSRSRTAEKSKSKSNPAPTPLLLYNNHNQHHHQYNNNNNSINNSSSSNTAPAAAYFSPVGNGIPSASVIQIAETNTRPVLIQLAPPPPPRTRRKRVDAFATRGQGEVDMREREKERTRMDVPRSVSGTGSNIDSSVRYSNGNDGEEGELQGDPLDELDLYSYSNLNAPQSYRYTQPEQRYHHQHLGYDGTPPLDGVATAYTHGTGVSGYNTHVRRTSQPITLTYEPPVMSGGLSMLETSETEGEMTGAGEDLDFEDVMDDDEDMGMRMEDMDGDLDLEDEMQKALSRSSSMATTMSGLSRGHHAGGSAGSNGTNKRRTSLRRVVGGGGVTANLTSIRTTKSAAAAVPLKPKTAKPKPKAKKTAMEDPATYIRKRGSIPVASPTRRLFGWEFAWDPIPLPAGGAGARGRRGSVGVVKKSRDAHGNGSWNEKEAEKAQESSFMDLRGSQRDAGAGSASTTVAVAVGVTARKLKRHSTPAGSVYARSVIGAGGGGMRRQEKWEDVFGVAMTSAAGQPPVVARVAGEMGNGNGNGVAAAKKLKKKRSQSVTRPVTADTPSRAAFVPGSAPAPSSNPGSGSALPHSANSNSYIAHDAIKTASSGTNKTSSRPGTADSANKGSHGSKASLGSGSSMRRGLQLKRSFKMSVGRTMGPGLTLASAGAVSGKQEWEEKGKDAERENARGRERRSNERVRTGEDEDEEDADVDVDGEIRSLAAARLVSASIARATPAATIVTAPSVGFSTPSPPPSAYQATSKSSPVNIAYPSLSSSSTAAPVAARPTLPAIVTSPIPIPTASAVPFPLSAPASRRPQRGFPPVVRSPSSAGQQQQPHTSGSTWMPHPFADPLEQTMPMSGAKSYITAGSEGGAASSIEDDVVQLEREMEEIRGRRGDGNDATDSPTTRFRELAAMVEAQAGPLSDSAPSPTLSSSMTPSLTSMFARAHAQAQNVAPPPPPKTSEKEKEKVKSKIFGGGHFQKRVALSSPPVAKSDWGPQSSVSSSGYGGGFLYRFPMIFPNSFTGSPPRSSPLVNGSGNGQSQAAVPRPGTPRGGSTLRLSAMETVRSTFASVGARMSSATSRMSVTSSAGASLRGGGGHGFGEMIMEHIDGDFMDLRDPFASPPPASNIATVAVPATTIPSKKSSGKNRGSEREKNGAGNDGAEKVPDALKRKMNTWGKLPMPVRSFSPAPSAGSGNASSSGAKRHSFVNGRPVVRVVGRPSSVHHRKHKKERRSRKATLPSMASAMGPLKAGAEDADFGLEEALLSQRLLNRLDSDDWESRM
ncbi:hypothetical protein CVT25_007257 [Psilocybe cyanescens]|uniref:Uncharacterized protein n=1 Tax=Psilocybe cyanescens TaxID=93625 RepID=A0A409WVF9_PSICY|nr:hypothetical protein CVT25_007257 [Psilocybe cyanescens]